MNRPSIYQKKLVHQSFWMFTLNEMRMKTMFSFRTHMNHSLCTSKVKNINFFFFFSSFWFWSLEMQMETIFTLYMNHSWFKAEEDWILLLIKVSLSHNTLFHPISLSLLNTFRKNSHLIHLAHCHSRVTPRVIQQQSSHYFSSSHLQSILHQKCIPQITSLLSKRIDLYTEWPIFRPKYTRARNKSVGKAFGERARVVGDVNATKNT